MEAIQPTLPHQPPRPWTSVGLAEDLKQGPLRVIVLPGLGRDYSVVLGPNWSYSKIPTIHKLCNLQSRREELQMKGARTVLQKQWGHYLHGDRYSQAGSKD